jgi:hypothetical protein
MKIIKRTDYLNELVEVKDTPDIKVITGVRRSGKSKLLELFIEDILEKDKKANIIHINYNLTDYEDLLEYHSLEKYIESKYKKNKNNYVLLDEVQLCKYFEKAINSLHAKEKFDIYVTGSNAFLQSSDLATLFVGRTYEIKLFPFSFKEYMNYYPSESNYKSMTNYILEGGMAGSYNYKTSKQKYKYLNDEVLNALVVRDIINKYKIRNESLLNRLIDFLTDNIGNLTSTRAITDFIAVNEKADHKTLAKYIEYLCKAFAFYKIRRYDIKGKKYLQTECKYYLSDHSFKFARLGTKNLDYGRVLENIVAIELLRRGYEVYVGVLRNKEIDFVAIKNGDKSYIQVSYDISDPKTFNREVAPLLAIPDAYPKILLSRINQPSFQHEGIKVIDISDWLLE